MLLTFCVLIILWLVPPTWVTYENVKGRKEYGQDTSVLRIFKQFLGLLDWPLSVMGWLRSR